MSGWMWGPTTTTTTTTFNGTIRQHLLVALWALAICGSPSGFSDWPLTLTRVCAVTVHTNGEGRHRGEARLEGHSTRQIGTGKCGMAWNTRNGATNLRSTPVAVGCSMIMGLRESTAHGDTPVALAQTDLCRHCCHKRRGDRMAQCGACMARSVVQRKSNYSTSTATVEFARVGGTACGRRPRTKETLILKTEGLPSLVPLATTSTTTTLLALLVEINGSLLVHATYVDAQVALPAGLHTTTCDWVVRWWLRSVPCYAP